MKQVVINNKFDQAMADQIMTATFPLDLECSISKRELDESTRSAYEAYIQFYQLNFEEHFPGKDIELYSGSVLSEEYSIFCQYWRPKKPTATVVICHGYYDHMGIYQKLISYLLEQGYAVLGFDLPGHGLSSGERAAIESFSNYSAGLQTILDYSASVLVGDIHVVGQSTGCAVIMNHILGDYPFVFSKVALLAPLVKPKGWNSGQWLFTLLNKRIQTMPRRFAVNSHDREFLRFLAEQDILQPKQLSVQWIGAMKEWMETLEARTEVSAKPLLIIQGTEDGTVDWEFNLPYIETHFTSVKVELIEEGRHQLVNEAPRFRKKVFAALGQYLKA